MILIRIKLLLAFLSYGTKDFDSRIFARFFILLDLRVTGRTSRGFVTEKNVYVAGLRLFSFPMEFSCEETCGLGVQLFSVDAFERRSL